MADFELPLSGNVTQSIFPLTVNIGESSNTDIERDALSIASYGKQLGRIEELLVVILNHVSLTGLSQHEADAVCDFKCMMHEIANIKTKHGARLILKPKID